MSDWIRALGIDYGTSRIGVAVSDDLGLFSHPLETVAGLDSAKAAERIALLVRNRRIDHLVVGLPLHLDGREGEAVARVRRFLNQLGPLLPSGVKVHEVDERLSTVSAREKLRASGRNLRNLKSVLDQAAAMEILQSWLDERAGREALSVPPEDPE